MLATSRPALACIKHPNAALLPNPVTTYISPPFFSSPAFSLSFSLFLCCSHTLSYLAASIFFFQPLSLTPMGAGLSWSTPDQSRWRTGSAWCSYRRSGHPRWRRGSRKSRCNTPPLGSPRTGSQSTGLRGCCSERDSVYSRTQRPWNWTRLWGGKRRTKTRPVAGERRMLSQRPPNRRRRPRCNKGEVLKIREANERM